MEPCKQEWAIAALTTEYKNMSTKLDEIKAQNQRLLDKIDDVTRTFATKEEMKKATDDIEKLKKDNVDFKILISKVMWIWLAVSFIWAIVVNKLL